MRVLVLFAHPVETSFGAALHAAVVEELRAAGHEVDDCDLLYLAWWGYADLAGWRVISESTRRPFVGKAYG